MPDSPALPEERPLATLRPQAGSEENAFAVLASIARIGQGPQNEIVLEDDTVSTYHAQLEFADGSWRLTDLDSRNGTYVEGVRLAPRVPTPLPNNSIVGFGAVTLAFRSREDVDPAALSTEPVATEKRVEVRRAGFRLPVWLLLVVLILIAALVVLFLTLGGDAPVGAAFLESGGTLVEASPSLAAA